MNSSELFERFRLDADDLANPPLWSDAEVFSYMDDAQKMFCRKTLGIPDVMPLATVVDQEWYAKSPLILKVRGATRLDTPHRGRPVEVMDYADFTTAGGYFDQRPGHLRFLVDGVRKNFFRAHAIPTEVMTLELAVYRLPLVALNDGDLELEIDEQHHLALIDWMLARGFRKRDADTYDPKRAESHEGRFLAYCADARTEQIRASHPPGVVQYGGL